ncbi:MAG: type II toxin-antitoxin system HicA family toxin [Dehalococcoidia bacterium]
MPSYKAREVERVAERLGFRPMRHEGSHRRWTHRGTVALPRPQATRCFVGRVSKAPRLA